MKDTFITILIVIGVLLVIAGFIYNYSVDSNTTQEECAPDYMTGDCSY